MELQMHYRSEALQRDAHVNLILPQGKENYKTLYLYHGLGGDENTWIKHTGIIRYAARHDLAVVMPYADRSWYTDTVYGVRWFTFVTEELPEVCRRTFAGMSRRREDTLVAGASMGGYGAVKAAFLRPETFGGCISLSGSLDITRKGRVVTEEFLQEWRGIFGSGLRSPSELEGGAHDLFAEAERMVRQGTPFPRLCLWCGEEDHLLQVNRRFHAKLQELGIEHDYSESQGDHSWKWWDQHIQSALAYVLGADGEK